LGLAEGVGTGVALGACLLCVCALFALGFELRGREGRSGVIWASCLLGLVSVLGALLRPVRIAVHGNRVGAKVVVLVDESRRLLLPTEHGTRRDVAAQVLPALVKHFGDARISVLGFGEGVPKPLPFGAPLTREVLSEDSDLEGALDALGREPGERPKAVV